MEKPYNVIELFRLWHSDLRTEEVAYELGISRSRLMSAAAKHGLKGRPVSVEDMTKGRVTDPTPEEIESACEALRKNWSPEEECRRRGGVFRWSAPVYRM
jgi:hypothetical protein